MLNETELAAVAKGINLGAPNLRRLEFGFDKLLQLPEDSIGLKKFIEAITRKRKNLEALILRIGALKPGHYSHFIKLFSGEFPRLKSLDLEHIGAQYMNFERGEFQIFGMTLCAKVRNLEFFRIVLKPTMVPKDQVFAIQELINTNCSTIKHIEIKLTEEFEDSSFNEEIKDVRKLLEGLNLQDSRNLTVLKLDFENRIDPNVCLYQELGSKLILFLNLYFSS